MAENSVKRPCNVVMKGGITSGIVYPATVHELSKRFQFKNIGGTSAGAIAAAVTAAAERRRLRGDASAFDAVERIPDELATGNLLFKLFRPNSVTSAPFRSLTFLLGRAPAMLKPLVVFNTPWALAGAIPGIVLFLLSSRTIVDAVLGFLLAVVGAGGAGALALVMQTMRAINRNYYGLVTGIDDRDHGTALTSWLENKIATIGGVDRPNTPLTFAMLWNAAAPAERSGLAERPPHVDVNLEVVATVLTYGRPVQFPCATSALFFRPDELRRFFPGHVVEWMQENRRPPRPDEVERMAAFEAQGYCAMPPIGDLPVIVSTRMSLAFPVLLSAVPLYAVDYSLKRNQGEGTVPQLEPVWFSDGGLSSNFPISLFDDALPQWPTFAINLGQFTSDYPQSPNENENIYIPKSNGAGRLPQFNRFTALPGFLGAVFDASRNWNDNVQMVLPGYRDRIVTIKLSPDEGGMNLDMPADVLMRLKRRGAAAGRRLVERFGTADGDGPPEAPQMGWNNHRWLRLRSTMGALRSYLSELSEEAQHPLPGDPTYDELIPQHVGRKDDSYRLPAGSAEIVTGLLDSTQALGTRYEDAYVLDSDLPKPPPSLQMRAPLNRLP